VGKVMEIVSIWGMGRGRGRVGGISSIVEGLLAI
jgi:hypothetical protein